MSKRIILRIVFWISFFCVFITLDLFTIESLALDIVFCVGAIAMIVSLVMIIAEKIKEKRAKNG